jgi:hypothetical protein
MAMRNVMTQQRAPNVQDEDYLTTSNDHLLVYPYIGLVRTSETRLATLTSYDSADMLSRTENSYCDSALGDPDTEPTYTTPCATTNKVKHPYMRKTVGTGYDLGRNAMPKVTTVNTLNTSDDVTKIVVTTEGLVNGSSQKYVKTVTNEYNANKTDGDNWILGRLKGATVRNTVPDLKLTASPGTAANATRTDGTVLDP